MDKEAYPASVQIARRVLTAFLFTFIATRVLVLLIMLRRVPDFFLHLGGTHVHHLNYGIFLLSITGAVTLFWNLSTKLRLIAAIFYGMGLALTFDEFGMWLHLGGGYWQRASYDAVIIIAGILSLAAAAPALSRFRSKNWITVVLLTCSVFIFSALVIKVSHEAEKKFGPEVHRIEQEGPQ